MIRLLVDPILASESSAALGTLEDEDGFLCLVTFFFISHASHKGTWSRDFGLGAQMAFLFLPQLAHFGY